MTGLVDCFLLFAVIGTPFGMWWGYYSTRNDDGTRK